MGRLPNDIDVTTAQGSQWSYTYGLQNSDGTPMNIVGKTFEFVVRRSITDTGSPLVRVDQTPTASGQLIVDTQVSSVQVVITATTTAAMRHGGGVYSLWMNPGQSDAVALAVGTFYTMQVAAP